MQNMLSILANWAQIIAVFLTIVAILIEVQQRRIRTQIRAVGIGFHPIWSPVLIRADEDHRDKIEIRYAGRNVSNMFILQAVVRNTGDLPIRRSHIVQPIRFTFRPEVELLNKPRIVNKNPENLMINWDFSKIVLVNNMLQ